MDERGQTYFAPEDEIPDADKKRLAEAEMLEDLKRMEALEDLKRIAARVRALEILQERIGP